MMVKLRVYDVDKDVIFYNVLCILRPNYRCFVATFPVESSRPMNPLYTRTTGDDGEIPLLLLQDEHLRLYDQLLACIMHLPGLQTIVELLQSGSSRPHDATVRLLLDAGEGPPAAVELAT
mmetsp:Transcript_20452/g.30497  ORF Transcript_20452/g.30497 Transcript_20452/m.30497 type:complete len:120 (-) Transcript_20452:1070-1429(-)